MRCSRCNRATSRAGSRIGMDGEPVCERKQCFTEFSIQMARNAGEIPTYPRRSTTLERTEQRRIIEA